MVSQRGWKPLGDSLDQREGGALEAGTFCFYSPQATGFKENSKWFYFCLEAYAASVGCV